MDCEGDDGDGDEVLEEHELGAEAETKIRMMVACLTLIILE